MTSEPPPEYVAFVSRHLEPLRRDAAKVVGDEHDADLLYPDVLTEVATHWGWIELRRTRLGDERAADVALSRAFARKSEQWLLPDQPYFHDVDVQVWTDDVEDKFVRPRYVSNAVRLAPMVAPKRRLNAGPVCEAAIAWWHAYEARRRRKMILIAAVGVFFLGILAHFSAPPV